MNFFKKQLLHHRLQSIFVDIRNNAFLLSGPTVRIISTLWLERVVEFEEGLGLSYSSVKAGSRLFVDPLRDFVHQYS